MKYITYMYERKKNDLTHPSVHHYKNFKSQKRSMEYGVFQRKVFGLESAILLT